MSSSKVNLTNILRHLSWPTICQAINELSEFIDNHEPCAGGKPDKDAVAFRNTLQQYMNATWPGKYKEYLDHREATAKNPAQTLANEISTTTVNGMDWRKEKSLAGQGKA